MAQSSLKAPFPWFGGKSRVSSVVWDRFRGIRNYVEPFCGSAAVLLSNPSPPDVETINDADGYLANFWRSVKLSPAKTAEWADHPVSEVDLIARHRWLCKQADFVDRLKCDPDYHDPKLAGWWVWGQCAWIGQGWCSRPNSEQLPHLGNSGMGINRKLPHLGDSGRGINRKLPHLGDSGRGSYILSTMQALAGRLRDVRIACGDWARVLGNSTLDVSRTGCYVGVFLDPPYDDGEHSIAYSGGGHVWEEVVNWCVENGENLRYKIALCGYEGGWTPPAGWETYAWKAAGGYASQSSGRGRENAHRERIWFSPACAKKTLPLFEGMT